MATKLRARPEVDAVPQETLPLCSGEVPAADRSFSGLRRLQLSRASWIDHQPGWLGGSDALLEELLASVTWAQHRRPMYERMVDEPRLTVWYPAGVAWPHPLLPELSDVLSARYGQRLVNLSCNLYRHGADSVAWHGDRVARHLPEPVVAIVSLGSPRPFLVRPKGGGPSRSFSAGWGDLLVMGGRCQQEFDHAVPKVSRAGTRVSVMFRPHDESWAARSGAVVREAGRWDRQV